MSPPPRRVVVTGPRRTTVRRPPPGLAGLDGQSPVGELLVRSLVRAQLALALRMLALVALGLGGLPLLFALVPVTREATVVGVRLPWLLLGLLVYPVLLGAGWLHVRRAERYEREFALLVERS